MKTNQTLSVPFRLGRLPIEHLTLLGDLREWFHVGNAYRREMGLEAMDYRAWLNRVSTKEYLEYFEQTHGAPAIVTTRGRNGKIRAHLKVLLSAAMEMSPAFKDEVLETFIQTKICDLRDSGGDLYQDMNGALALAAEGVLGKPAHKGHFITLAKAIKERCGVEGDWNLAGVTAHAKRVAIEDRLASVLRLNLVRDWDHLKELAKEA